MCSTGSGYAAPAPAAGLALSGWARTLLASSVAFCFAEESDGRKSQRLESCVSGSFDR